MEEVKEVLERENKFLRILAAGGRAYHSAHMLEDILGSQFSRGLKTKTS